MACFALVVGQDAFSPPGEVSQVGPVQDDVAWLIWTEPWLTHDDVGECDGVADIDETRGHVQHDLEPLLQCVLAVPDLDKGISDVVDLTVPVGAGPAVSDGIIVDGTTFGQLLQGQSAVADWTRVEVRFTELTHLWGDDTNMDWEQVTTILFAVSGRHGDMGGAGTVEIADITLIP